MSPSRTHLSNPVVVEKGRFLTLYWDDELRDYGEDPLGPALGQEILDAVGGQEHVRVGGLAEAVEEERKVVVVVQGVDRDLQ